MMLDHQNLCSEDQTLAFNIGTVVSTNVIDLGKAGKGRGVPVEVFAQLTADFDSAGDTGTLQVICQTSAAEAMTSPVTHADTGALAQATCVKGYKPVSMKLPSNALQYLRFSYVIATANGAGGTITAGICVDEQTNKDPDSLGLNL